MRSIQQHGKILERVSRPVIGAACSLAGGVCLSTGGIALRLVESAEPFQIVFYRAAAFLLLIWSILALRYRRRLWDVTLQVGLPGLAVAGLLGVGAIFYVFAILNTTVANAVVILSTSPILTALLAWFALGTRVSGTTLVAAGGALLGVCLMVADGLSSGGLLGMLIAGGAVICYAVMLVLLQGYRNRDMLPATALSGFVTLAIAWAACTDLDVSPHDIGISAFLGAFQFGLGFILLTVATRFIDGALVALIGLSEVALGPIWVWIGVGEIPTRLALVGASVVASSVAFQIVNSRAERSTG